MSVKKGKESLFWGRVKGKVKGLVNSLFRVGINRKNKKRLKNQEITLISSNCNGCLILHDLGLRYNSPFVNLFIGAEDYIRLLSDFESYMEKELCFIKKEGCSYPVALLGDVTLHFVHYESSRQAAEKWEERRARMDLSRCFVLFSEQDGCTEEHLRAFDALPFENKAVFTHKPYGDVGSAVYIPGFEQQGQVGSLYRYKGWRGLKYYDDFDYVSWFNGEKRP